MSNTLYLASQSIARHRLLTQAQIPYVVIPINVCEEEAVVSGSVYDQVKALAEYKHSGIDVAAVAKKHDRDKPLFFLASDTLIYGQDSKTLYGKPRDGEHARDMLREIAQQEIVIATGMCLSVYVHTNGTWDRTAYEVWDARAGARFAVDEQSLDTYMNACPAAMYACGATVIEEIGIRYFESLDGSFTGALGLDLFALCKVLKKYSFWSQVKPGMTQPSP